MPLGTLSMPDCDVTLCNSSLYKRGDDGEPLCKKHYLERHRDGHEAGEGPE